MLILVQARHRQSISYIWYSGYLLLFSSTCLCDRQRAVEGSTPDCYGPANLDVTNVSLSPYPARCAERPPLVRRGSKPDSHRLDVLKRKGLALQLYCVLRRLLLLLLLGIIHSSPQSRPLFLFSTPFLEFTPRAKSLGLSRVSGESGTRIDADWTPIFLSLDPRPRQVA